MDIDMEGSIDQTISPDNVINFSFRDIRYTRCDRKDKTPNRILKGISGTFTSGRLVGILGPSGAGKSSLLNVLSGFRETGVQGSIRLNGAHVSTDKSGFRKACCYITQDAAMLDQLTARETLCTATKLKLKTGCNTRKIVVEDIAKLLNLTKCLDTRVECLSGGEKKRLSIGVELVTNPPIMFFDEPTSGLDSVSSYQLMTHLRQLARGGRSVICAIHQPSSRLTALFDDVMLLSAGRAIFLGPLDDLVGTLEQFGHHCPQFYNRADFALEVASLERGDDLEALMEASEAKWRTHYDVTGAEMIQYDTNKNAESSLLNKIPLLNGAIRIELGETEPLSCSLKRVLKKRKESLYSTSFFSQFVVLLQRALLCTSRDFYFAQLRVLAHALVGLLLGGVFWGIGGDAAKVPTNASCIFFFLMFIFFANSMPTVLTFPKETAVFLREHHNNWYSLGSYYLSKLIADLPLQLICPSCFILVAYFMTGQPHDYCRFGHLWLVCLLVALVAQSIGLVSGAAFDVQLGTFLVPAFCIPMLVFSGFFMHLSEVPSHLLFLCDLSYFRYAFGAAIFSIYGNGRDVLECSQPFCFYKSPDKFLSDMGLQNEKYWFDIGMLVVWFVGLQILLYVILMVKLCRSR